MMKSAVTAVALAIASLGSAQAAVLNLNAYLGNANVFSFTNFSAPSADVEGAILAGGNVSLTSYTVNKNNQDAYGQYAMVVGGSLTFGNGNIHNGNVYVSGDVTYPSYNVLDKGYTTVKGTAPVNLSNLASGLVKTSAELAAISATANTKQVNSQIFLTGTKSGVDVVTVSAAQMNSATEFVLSNFATDATIIVNVVGKTATIQGGYKQFDAYNVLFNFVDATTLNIGTGANISILAPTASVKDGSGVIDGNVVVKSWSSGVQINSTNAFVSTNVAGLVTAIPEPETYAMLLGGLGLMGFMARRRQKAAAPAR
ncbi:choice-of-anchor A family protein [Duganella sp. CY42W]|uniref:Choice-of-anchor A family protein n=1 Tax=Duganella levis TaxID=2692169 RepID=A0ABW9W2G5_9BURK|nr:choice-of-anchor A family protein [Duganella levis]MYN28158.1 choice-of-anchor A family protein [Duganella levis]